MNKNYSLSGLIQFLDYIASKGMAARETVMSRKTACEKVLGILDESERTDLRSIDLEQVINRFSNLHGTTYTPESLRIYASRVKTSIAEFVRYTDNPQSYKAPASRSKGDAGQKKNNSTGTKPSIPQSPPSLHGGQTLPSVNPAAGLVVPVPIRTGVYITISGIPADLSADEAEKVANVIKAFGGAKAK